MTSEYPTRASARERARSQQYEQRGDQRRGRSARQRGGRGAGRNLVSPLIAAGAVLLLVTGTGVALAQGGLFSANADGGAGCSNPVELVVVADPSIAAPLGNVAKRFDDEASSCVVTRVEEQASSDTAALLASGALVGVDAWVPDSLLWLTRMESTAETLGRTAPPLGDVVSIASSPVVLGAPAARSIEFSGEALSWAALLSGDYGVVLPDPDLRSASAAGIVSLADAAPGDDDRRVASSLIEFGKVIPPTVTEAANLARDAALPTVVFASERDVVLHNAASPDAPLVALYPTEGTTSVDFPLVHLPSASSDSNMRESLVAELASVAHASPEFFHAAGLRDHRGDGKVNASGVADIVTTSRPAADTESQVWAIDQWISLTRPSRMLVTVDVSGSMAERVGADGLSRIEIYQRAATHQLYRYGPHAEMGVWVFSTNRDGNQDWEQLAEVASLGNDAHRSHIASITAQLPNMLSGDTGLYDTILAAYKHMRETYKPGMVNSIVLITDGRNDDRVTITLDQLLSELDALADPQRPLPVILIGFGPDTDMPSMQAIATKTGGHAFSALEPADLDKVFVDAFKARECRPNC